MKIHHPLPHIKLRADSEPLTLRLSRHKCARLARLLQCFQDAAPAAAAADADAAADENLAATFDAAPSSAAAAQPLASLAGSSPAASATLAGAASASEAAFFDARGSSVLKQQQQQQQQQQHSASATTEGLGSSAEASLSTSVTSLRASKGRLSIAGITALRRSSSTLLGNNSNNNNNALTGSGGSGGGDSASMQLVADSSFSGGVLSSVAAEEEEVGQQRRLSRSLDAIGTALSRGFAQRQDSLSSAKTRTRSESFESVQSGASSRRSDSDDSDSFHSFDSSINPDDTAALVTEYAENIKLLESERNQLYSMLDDIEDAEQEHVLTLPLSSASSASAIPVPKWLRNIFAIANHDGSGRVERDQLSETFTRHHLLRHVLRFESIDSDQGAGKGGDGEEEDGTKNGVPWDERVDRLFRRRSSDGSAGSDGSEEMDDGRMSWDDFGSLFLGADQQRRNLRLAIGQCDTELAEFKSTYHDMIAALQDVVTDSARAGAFGAGGEGDSRGKVGGRFRFPHSGLLPAVAALRPLLQRRRRRPWRRRSFGSRGWPRLRSCSPSGAARPRRVGTTRAGALRRWRRQQQRRRQLLRRAGIHLVRRGFARRRSHRRRRTSGSRGGDGMVVEKERVVREVLAIFISVPLVSVDISDEGEAGIRLVPAVAAIAAAGKFQCHLSRQERAQAMRLLAVELVGMELQAHVRTNEAVATLSMSDFGIEDCGTTERMHHAGGFAGSNAAEAGSREAGSTQPAATPGAAVATGGGDAGWFDPALWALRSRHRHFLATSAPDLPRHRAAQVGVPATPHRKRPTGALSRRRRKHRQLRLGMCSREGRGPKQWREVSRLCRR